MENVGEEYANLALKRFYDTATNNIQTSALVNRALADKISTETINQKVNNQLNSIYTSMTRINPKFNETSKNYGIIKQDILDVLTDYELALTELSDYYDNQLEELILKKVELESNLVGKVFREENIKKDENIRIKFKDKDMLKMSFSERAKNIAEKVSAKKQTNSSIDFTDIRKLQELNDLEVEQTNRLDKKILKLQERDKTNQAEIVGLENEIKKVSKQIKEINEKKRLGLEAAMETREKWISVTLRKPSVWNRTKSFFSNRFSTAKVVSKTVIAPLKMKVKEFRVNELEGLKG
ncbi:MAG: hypothetical protein IJ629_01965 [Clostridia bacterium]|nr:hypothetical protein [Clostridia bacterium]